MDYQSWNPNLEINEINNWSKSLTYTHKSWLINRLIVVVDLIRYQTEHSLELQCNGHDLDRIAITFRTYMEIFWNGEIFDFYEIFLRSGDFGTGYSCSLSPRVRFAIYLNNWLLSSWKLDKYINLSHVTPLHGHIWTSTYSCHCFTVNIRKRNQIYRKIHEILVIITKKLIKLH